MLCLSASWASSLWTSLGEISFGNRPWALALRPPSLKQASLVQNKPLWYKTDLSGPKQASLVQSRPLWYNTGFSGTKKASLVQNKLLWYKTSFSGTEQASLASKAHPHQRKKPWSMPYLIDFGEKKTSRPSPQPSSALSPQPSGLAPMGFPRQLLAIGLPLGRCLEGGGGRGGRRGRRRRREEGSNSKRGPNHRRVGKKLFESPLLRRRPQTTPAPCG